MCSIARIQTGGGSRGNPIQLMASNPASQSEQDSATNAVEMELKFQELNAVTRRAFLGARAHLAAWRRLLQVLDALLDTGNPVCLLHCIRFFSILHLEICSVNYNSSRESSHFRCYLFISLRRAPGATHVSSRDQLRRTAGELESLEGVCSPARRPRVALSQVKSRQ